MAIWGCMEIADKKSLFHGLNGTGKTGQQTNPLMQPKTASGGIVMSQETKITLPSCARRSVHRQAEDEVLGGKTKKLLQIKQFSILRISKGAVFSSMYVTAHLIDFITIIHGRGGLCKPRHDFFVYSSSIMPTSCVCKGALLRTHKEMEQDFSRSTDM